MRQAVQNLVQRQSINSALCVIEQAANMLDPTGPDFNIEALASADFGRNEMLPTCFNLEGGQYGIVRVRTGELAVKQVLLAAGGGLPPRYISVDTTNSDRFTGKPTTNLTGWRSLAASEEARSDIRDIKRYARTGSFAIGKLKRAQPVTQQSI